MVITIRSQVIIMNLEHKVTGVVKSSLYKSRDYLRYEESNSPSFQYHNICRYVVEIRMTYFCYRCSSEHSKVFNEISITYRKRSKYRTVLLLVGACLNIAAKETVNE